MATWDGSYQDPDGSTYYVSSSNNQASANIHPWNCYTNNAYAQSAIGPYPIENSITFERSHPDFYNSTNRNGIPSMVPNIAQSTNSYFNEDVTAVANENSTKSESHLNNSDQCFFEDNRRQAQQCHNKNNYFQGNKRKDYKNYYSSDLVEHSNLQPTATEFIPNQNMQEHINFVDSNKSYNRSQWNKDNEDQDAAQPANVPHADNRQKYNDRKFETKKDTGNRWRDTQDGQFYKENRKDYERNQNSRRPQNDRYNNYNRNYSDKPRDYAGKPHDYSDKLNHFEKNELDNVYSKINANSDVERNLSGISNGSHSNKKSYSAIEAGNTSSISNLSARNSKPCPNNGRSDKYYDRKERYNPRDPRDRRSNYPEHNGYNRNNYNRDNKYEKRTFRENTDKEITDWRVRNGKSLDKPVVKRLHYKKYEPDDAASQRERLTELLNRGQLECLVCCEYIRQQDYVWSCKNCFHVIHLKCVQMWATSSHDDSGWRCPACQNVTTSIPIEYLCFCGKTTAPIWNRQDIAHSCGEICGRSRTDIKCIHKCTLLCHPGCCPPCDAMVTKSCGCGRMQQTQKCSTDTLIVCKDICGRVLNCNVHKCEKPCHHGSCEPCNQIVKQECFCGKHTREQTCILDLPPMYSCENKCEKMLDCGNHKCQDICHAGECVPCLLKPEIVRYCCCGQTLLTVKRENCLDPIPTCDKICSKRLKCGQPSNPHTCHANCHEGDCPECDLFTKVRCRCGHMDKEIPCKELTTKADDARCEKKCTKKRSCGKHKCNQKCCIDIEHICKYQCVKILSCGKHRCEETCHKGRCQPCWRSSFEELYCECGAKCIDPPVPCGTRRPACDQPCSREHSCDHPVLHHCHSDPECPPCSILSEKWCYGKHELRKSVPCYLNEISCGLPCNKLISCGRHKCIQMCHSGPCEKPGQICVQPCTMPRELCGHSCAAPCHEGKCPDVPCKEMVKVTCQCGHRTMSRVCAENARDYQRIASGILASKMTEVQLGHSINLEEVFGQGIKKQNQLKTLECNEECKILERNRRLTLGLQIVNPDLSGKLMPKYNNHMKHWGKKDPAFCQMVHDKLTELVQKAKVSKQKSRSLSFEIMTRDKRQFVHESCEHFGCEAQAYDDEPKRNIVATAVKDKCWLPSYSLLELLQRESGQRKVPGPMLNSTDRNKEVTQLNSKKSLKSLPTTSASPPKSPESDIDYFNYKG
ncbi:protein shuttle craft-like [Phymastichus coffea]|uniref:protein shuttle craft-like n=1 Tax=Phymastichus coffea TaxID=108790 RepID=UPI00273B13CC|nr:protein shuttle craft-like [Phymastichus coffea]